MTPPLRYPPKPGRGNAVAVLSPSAGLPGRFPLPFELGLVRLRNLFGLVPVEYPTSRVMGASPADRARDVNAAFADPAVKAVIASIGGEDQLKVLPYPDADLIKANPKPFFGFRVRRRFPDAFPTLSRRFPDAFPLLSRLLSRRFPASVALSRRPPAPPIPRWGPGDGSFTAHMRIFPGVDQLPNRVRGR